MTIHDPARAARDAALAAVERAAGGWSRAARDRVRALPVHWEGTGEDIRLKLVRDGFPEPRSHNAWGAMIMVCVKHDWLREIGRGQMRTEKSHARSTAIYARTRKP